MTETETIVACLTAPGTGAIAVLGLSGPRSWELVRELFTPRSRSHERLPATAEPGRFWLGRLGTDLADEVVVVVRRREPFPVVEVHCHGGREMIRYLTGAFVERGCRCVSWQQFQAAMSCTPHHVAAFAALAQAPTQRTAAILLDQLHGAFASAVAEAARLEDHGRLLQRLACLAQVGRHLTQPWRVVVAGAPNVGKSSLVNALAGYTRSVVSPTPGTTRDLVTTVLAVDGWPVALTDTAGLHESATGLEQAGIALALAELRAADLVLWVTDGAALPVWPTQPDERHVQIINKIDLAAAWDWQQAVQAVRISARTGLGLQELCQRLAARLVPHPPEPGEGVPFTSQLCDWVESAWRHYQGGQTDAAVHLLERCQSMVQE